MAAPVKHFFETDSGAPQISGQAGAGIAWLDALLVNGFNLQNITALTQSGGVATCTKAGHGFRQYQVVEFAGANEGVYNDQFMVLSAGANDFTFAIDPAAPATATGTLTCKAAPLGWIKEFAGTNKAVYRSQAFDSSQCRLRVDDSSAQFMAIRAYKTMSDIDTGTSQTPTGAQQAIWNWVKSETASSQARKYTFVGDDRTFGFACAYKTNAGAIPGSGNWPLIYGGGDFISYKPADAYNFFLHGQNSTVITQTYTGTSGYNQDSTSGPYCPSAYSQAGVSIQLYKRSNALNGASGGGSIPGLNPEDSAVHIWGRHIFQDGATDLRGIQPGAYHLPQLAPLTDGAFLSDVDGFPGKIFLFVGCANVASEQRMAIDITGPWR